MHSSAKKVARGNQQFTGNNYWISYCNEHRDEYTNHITRHTFLAGGIHRYRAPDCHLDLRNELLFM